MSKNFNNSNKNSNKPKGEWKKKPQEGGGAGAQPVTKSEFEAGMSRIMKRVDERDTHAGANLVYTIKDVDKLDSFKPADIANVFIATGIDGATRGVRITPKTATTDAESVKSANEWAKYKGYSFRSVKPFDKESTDPINAFNIGSFVSSRPPSLLNKVYAARLRELLYVGGPNEKDAIIRMEVMLSTFMAKYKKEAEEDA